MHLGSHFIWIGCDDGKAVERFAVRSHPSLRSPANANGSTFFMANAYGRIFGIEFLPFIKSARWHQAAALLQGSPSHRLLHQHPAYALIAFTPECLGSLCQLGTKPHRIIESLRSPVDLLSRITG